MKLRFTKLPTRKNTIYVSFDGGNTYTTYDKSTVSTEGIDIPDDISSFSQIAIRVNEGGGITSDFWYEPDTLGNYNAIKSKVPKLRIPNGVTSISNWAFGDCTSLTSIEIPNSITSIGAQAFQNCTNLTSIEIPSNVTSIQGSAFQNCTSLMSINIDEGNSYFSSEDGILYNKNKTSLVLCLPGKTSVTIPNGVTSIGNCAFYECTRLTSINISSSVTLIGDQAFEGCTGLTSINIPSGVTTIGNSAFSSCSGLTSINIPSGVTTIGNSAFQCCSGLTSITIPSGVTSINRGAFANCTSLATINFTGPQSRWNAINKGYDWELHCPSSMVINYNYQG